MCIPFPRPPADPTHDPITTGRVQSETGTNKSALIARQILHFAICLFLLIFSYSSEVWMVPSISSSILADSLVRMTEGYLMLMVDGWW